jgi:hypothetical protein
LIEQQVPNKQQESNKYADYFSTIRAQCTLSGEAKTEVLGHITWNSQNDVSSAEAQ